VIRRGGEPWREARYLVVDVETTGLRPESSEIIAFAAVPVEDGRVRVGGAIHGLVRPSRPPDGETVRIHGLRPADLAAAPAAPDGLRPLLDALDGRIAVGHAAWFDAAFLRRHEPWWRRRRPLRRRWVDTYALGRLLATERGEPAPRPLRLPDLAAWLGVPPGRRHDALGDALTTAQAFVVLATRLDAMRSRTADDLLGAGDELRRLRGRRRGLRPAWWRDARGSRS
jgi:DNA polymerase III subunit epsilon